MKIARQFQNENYAKYYADIKIHIETCYRNWANPTDALVRLMEDNLIQLKKFLKKKMTKLCYLNHSF